jgi:hypothetical protein
VLFRHYGIFTGQSSTDYGLLCGNFFSEAVSHKLSLSRSINLAVPVEWRSVGFVQQFLREVLMVHIVKTLVKCGSELIFLGSEFKFY